MNESPSDETDYGSKSTSTGGTYSDNASRRNQPKPTTSTQPEISMKNFLDFLATAYRLNDALENYPLETYKKSNTIDWNQLSACKFVSGLNQNNNFDKSSLKQSHDHGDTVQEETNGNGVKQNGAANGYHDNYQVCEQGSSERLDEDNKPLVKQNSKRGEKHKRGRSASLGGSRGEKTKLEKRRSFAKKESLESRGKSRGEVNLAERQVKRKLSEVLQEGILDSVLPYLIPKQNCNLSPKKTISIMDKKNCHDKPSNPLPIQPKDSMSIYHSKKQNFALTESSSRESAKE